MNWSWLEIAAMAAVGLGIILGVAGAIILYLSRPSFWWGVAIFFVQKVGPAVVKAFLKLFTRMSPEEEAEWHQAIREGRADEWLRKRSTRHGGPSSK